MAIKTNENISLSEEIKLHGVVIRKMPNGQYFKALQVLQQLPENFMKNVFEGKEKLKLSEFMNIENIGTLVTRLLCVLPDFTLKFLAELMDIDFKIISEILTPLETIEIVEKFWEVNKLGDFFDKVKPVIQKTLSKIDLTGFNAQ